MSGTRPPSSTISTLFSAFTARLRSVQPASSRMLSSRDRSKAIMWGRPATSRRHQIVSYTGRARSTTPGTCLLPEQHELCCRDSPRDLECTPALALEPCREFMSSGQRPARMAGAVRDNHDLDSRRNGSSHLRSEERKRVMIGCRAPACTIFTRLSAFMDKFQSAPAACSSTSSLLKHSSDTNG